MALTESRDLHKVEHNKEANTVTVTWMNRIYRDGVEVDSARTAETKSYQCDTQEGAVAFHDDLGDESAKYAMLFNQGA